MQEELGEPGGDVGHPCCRHCSMFERINQDTHRAQDGELHVHEFPCFICEVEGEGEES